MNADTSATIVRFRDGRVYTSLPIDFEGGAPLEEIFPFFHWLVAEVDFANFKATGATFIVDQGGDGATLEADGYVAQTQTVDACLGDATTNGTVAGDDGFGVPDGVDDADAGDGCSHDGGLSRTETGPVLTQGIQGFLGQKSTIHWGKKAYDLDENGGISGVAVYAITRAEDDPAYAAAEEWEPGIPRVQIALFNSDRNEAIVDGNKNVIADPVQPDVDNHPLGWGEDTTGTVLPGAEDIDRNGNNAFDMGDAIDVTWTDSWDDSQPTNCGGANQLYDVNNGDPLIADNKCFDGLRNWNQARPAVFDGGYAFGGSDPHLDSGYYIVQAYTPPGYELMREEHKNVDFGDEYAVPTLLPPACVGADHTVPELLAFVTVPDGAGGFTPIRSDAAEYTSPFATDVRPLCDARHIRVADGKNAAADFHFMTPVNKAAHVVGGVINDLANEFNRNAPTFGEKFAPPWVPVAFYDYKGHEITRVYTDQFGKYNAMLPSTNTVSIASPSGVSPNMVTACMNDSGMVDDPTNPGNRVIDPNHNPQYSQFCYVFQYMPGGTTYLDTPVQNIAAFAGSGRQLDCAAADLTPMISSVTSGSHQGPFAMVGAGSTGNDRLLTITSMGVRSVANPSVDELATNNKILRNYGFGIDQGSVSLRNENGNQVRTLQFNGGTSWTDNTIVGRVRGNTPRGSYQLVVVTPDGSESPMGVTLHVGDTGTAVTEVLPSASDNATQIQDAIDNATTGDLLLITAGVYNEIPIMWKPVYLQGAGAGVTTINARSAPTELVENWHAKMDALLGLTGGPAFIDMLPGQEIGPALFATEAGSGITVVGPEFGVDSFSADNGSRIDGFTITGASTGGGIFANGFIDSLRVSNNVIAGNQGTYGGGIRLGHPTLTAEIDPIGDAPPALVYPDALNDNIRIHHNMITRNGTINGAGAGISVYTGADGYRIKDNLICGNFASTDGAGIGHLGKSSNGRIEDNTIIFNQSFRQTPGFDTDGGGILIAGKPGLAGAPLGDGSGNNIFIDRNLIQGNQAGAGDGGGIALRSVNGTEVNDAPSSAGQWNRVLIRNNTIVNNVAGLAGAGISLKDAARVQIHSNTVANNDSTATAGVAFTASPTVSTAQVAGIVSRLHSPALAGAIGYGTGNGRYGRGFSNPTLNDNIIWHNRSHHYELNSGVGGDDQVVLNGYSDLGIVPAPANPNWRLTPRDSLLTDATGYNGDNLDDGDVNGTEVFITEYFNGNPFTSPSPAEFTTIQVAPALDEGGNWIDVRYAPLSINDIDGTGKASDYHLAPLSVAIDSAQGQRPTDRDIDLDRPGENGTLDMGSDEVYE